MAPVPDPQLVAFATLGAVALLALAAWRADWRRFAAPADAHLFWGVATAVAMLRQLGGEPFDGVHLLGAAAACALLGFRVAVVALAAGIGLQHAADGLHANAWAASWLVAGVLPAAVTRAVTSLLPADGRRLGPLPAVGAAFAAGGASMLAVVGARSWLGWLPPIAPHDTTAVAALAAAMAVAEAQLAATVVVLVAVRRPDWLMRDARAGRRPRR